MAGRRAKSRKSKRAGKGFDDEDFEDGMDGLGEDMEGAGREFGKRIKRHCREKCRGWEGKLDDFGVCMDGKGKRWERKWNGFWYGVLGPIGPFVLSLIGLACLLLMVFILNFANSYLGTRFIAAISGFVLANLEVFFGVSLLTGYLHYFSRACRGARWVFRPLSKSISFAFSLWIFAFVLELVNSYLAIGIIGAIASFLVANLYAIFAIVLAISLVFSFFKKIFWD